MTFAMVTSERADLDRTRRAAALVYASASVLLLPWIVVLAVIQPARNTAHLGLVRAFLVAVIAALAACVVLAPRTIPVAGPALATFALLTAWFDAVTAESITRRTAVGLGLLLATGITAMLSTLAVRRRPWLGGGAGRAALFVLAAVSVLAVALGAHRAAAPVPVQHLKTAWVGLDVAEAVALAGVAYAVWTGAGWLRVVGSVTAALLVLDACINIATSSGVRLLQALAMALVELPLAAGALALAITCPDRRSRSGP